MRIWQEIFNRIWNAPGKTLGEAVAEATGGANLVQGKQTWELVAEGKHDIEIMKRCCAAEMETYAKTGLFPAPYYFERVAVLARKLKDYDQEIMYCETYIRLVDEYYRSNNLPPDEGINASPTYQAIVERLAKARLLAAKQRATG
jgi:hypothetical protein